MTVQSLIDALALKVVTLTNPDREVTGGYAGDLLSWVMGRAKEGDAWITIMTNLNVVAVASLADVSCVLLAEGVDVPEDVATTAAAKDVTLLVSELPTYELCGRVSALLTEAAS